MAADALPQTVIPRRSCTLESVCRHLATPHQWLQIQTLDVDDLHPLRRAFSDDFSEFGRGEITPYMSREYADPDAANAYLAAKLAERTIVASALAFLENGGWQPTLRQSGSANETPVEYRLLREGTLDLRHNTVTLESAEYHLRFSYSGVSRLSELEHLIEREAANLDPNFNTITDLQDRVEAAAGHSVNLATFKTCMKKAGCSPDWFRRGRKRGRPAIQQT